MIDFTLIGTAATMPTPERALSSATLSCAGHVLLFDCGEGTQTAARKAHAPIMRADAVCLTHYHGDHIFGLPGLLQTMSSLGRSRPLHIFGPDGLPEAMAAITQLCGPLPYELKLMTLPPQGLRLCEALPGFPPAAMLEPIATQHRVPSIGYRFSLSRPGRFLVEKALTLGVPQSCWRKLQQGESVSANGSTIAPADVLGEPRQGLCVVFSGDTAPCDALLAAARGADLLVMDATYGDDTQEALAREYGHSTFAQAAALAAQAHAKRLWLTHYSGMISDPGEYLPNAQAFFPGAVCGADGLSLTLSFEE